MPISISAAYLASNLIEVLERVKLGEVFEVHDACRPIATIAGPPGAPGITVEDLVARVGNLRMPGGGFADDLEAIQGE